MARDDGGLLKRAGLHREDGSGAKSILEAAAAQDLQRQEQASNQAAAITRLLEQLRERDRRLTKVADLCKDAQGRSGTDTAAFLLASDVLAVASPDLFPGPSAPPRD